MTRMEGDNEPLPVVMFVCLFVCFVRVRLLQAAEAVTPTRSRT